MRLTCKGCKLCGPSVCPCIVHGKPLSLCAFCFAAKLLAKIPGSGRFNVTQRKFYKAS